MSTVDFSYPIQAIRIPFTISINNANALELSIDYSCGIEIYGNGFLVFQDNVDSFDRNATGCYREHHHHVLLMSTQEKNIHFANEHASYHLMSVQ